MKCSITIWTLLVLPLLSFGQQVERHVIVSSGHLLNSDAVSFQGSLGQIVIGASPELGISQGFEQPIPKLKVLHDLSFATCQDGGLGILSLDVDSSCPGDVMITVNGIEVVSPISGLEPGTYSVTASADNYCTNVFEVEITSDDLPTDCALAFYNVIYPNGHDSNQSWFIENIEKEENRVNEVYIYNRWGVMVWSGINYDNHEVIWDGASSQGDPLSDATYYYLVKIGEQEYSGYVEIIR